MSRLFHMCRSELGLTALFTFAGVLIAWRGVELRIGSLSEPQPGFFPFMAGAALVVLGAIQCAIVFQQRPSAAQPSEGPSAGWKPAAIIAALFIYALMLEATGYLAATSLLAMTVMMITHRPKWFVLLPVAIGVSIVTYVVFNDLLGVSLPAGTLFSR